MERISTEQPRISIPTFAEREAAAGLTGTTSGREGTFYEFGADQYAPTDEVTDWGVHDAQPISLAEASSTIPVILCVNGLPRYATINGTLGGPVV